MLLYDLHYYTIDGRRLPDMDSAVALPDTARLGEIIKATCVNGDPRDVRWVGERGRCAAPEWLYAPAKWLVDAVCAIVRDVAIDASGLVVVGTDAGAAHPTDLPALRRALGGAWYSAGSRPPLGRHAVAVPLSSRSLLDGRVLHRDVVAALTEHARRVHSDVR